MNIKLLVFSCALLFITLAWNNYAPPIYQAPQAIFILAYFFLLTAFVNYQLLKINTKSPKNFIKAYMASTAIRLFANLIILTVFMLIAKQKALVFTITFLVYYFLFLVFEVVTLIKDTKQKA